MTQFDSNSFEHDYIVNTLNHMLIDLSTQKSKSEIVDKHACILTAFMNGQIVAAVKQFKGEK